MSAREKVLVAHPSRVAQADQWAAERGVEKVALKTWCPPSMAYIVDLDYLKQFPEDEPHAS